MQVELFPEEVAENRCGVCSEGFFKQCILSAGHIEKRHVFADIHIEEYWED
jgi:hypothetical protein